MVGQASTPCGKVFICISNKWDKVVVVQLVEGKREAKVRLREGCDFTIEGGYQDVSFSRFNANRKKGTLFIVNV